MSQSEDWKSLKEKERLLRKAAQILSVSESDLPRVVERFLKEIEEMKSRSRSSS